MHYIIHPPVYMISVLSLYRIYFNHDKYTMNYYQPISNYDTQYITGILKEIFVLKPVSVKVNKHYTLYSCQKMTLAVFA